MLPRHCKSCMDMDTQLLGMHSAPLACVVAVWQALDITAAALQRSHLQDTPAWVRGAGGGSSAPRCVGTPVGGSVICAPFAVGVETRGTGLDHMGPLGAKDFWCWTWVHAGGVLDAAKYASSVDSTQDDAELRCKRCCRHRLPQHVQPGAAGTKINQRLDWLRPQ